MLPHAAPRPLTSFWRVLSAAATAGAALAATGCGAPSEEELAVKPPMGTHAQPLSFLPRLPYPADLTMGVSQGWGGAWSHQGNLYYAIDFNLPGNADLGVHVLAVEDGAVTYRYEDCTCEGCSCNGGWGNAIVVDHGGGEYSKYTHLQTDSIPDSLQVGSTVCQGLHLGNIGNTGNSTGSHLHFQFQSDGTLNGPSIPFERFEETSGVPQEGGNYTSMNDEQSSCADPTGCSVSIDGGTTVVDDQTDCFSRSGQYWWEQSYGHDGHHWYTYTIDEPDPDCTGRWELNVVAADSYQVEVFVPDNPDALSSGVTYRIHHNGSTDTAEVDQQASRGSWVSLGSYDFAQSFEQHLRILDNTGEPYVDEDGPRLVLDAVRLTSAAACSDECSASERRCSGQGWQQCDDFDADPCLEWGGGGPCEPGTHCEGGECVPGDPPDGGSGGAAGSAGAGGSGGAGAGAAAGVPASAGEGDLSGNVACRLGRPAPGRLGPSPAWLLLGLLLAARRRHARAQRSTIATRARRSQ